MWMFIRLMAALNIAWIAIKTTANTEIGLRAPVKIPERTQRCVRTYNELEHNYVAAL